MKKIDIYSSLLLVFVFLLGACEDTNENLVQQRGVAVVPSISNVEPSFFTTDFDNAFVQFDVNLPEGTSVDAAELHASFKDKTALIQPITSFPSTIKLTAREVMNKLGLSDQQVDVVDNNQFNFFVQTTSNGVTTRSRTGALRTLVTCEFDEALAVGDYRVVSADWDVEGDVTLTADPDDPYKIYVAGLFEMEGGAPNDNLLELNISRTSFEIEAAAKQILGSTTPWASVYTDYGYTVRGGLFKSCDGTFDVQVQITVAQGSFGNFNFTFRRK